MDDRDVLGLLDLSGLKNDFDKTFEDMTNNFDELIKSTSRLETNARDDYHNSQMRNLNDMHREMEDVFDVASEYLEELDEELNDIFLEDRRKDLRKFDTIHRRATRKNQRRSDDFFESIGEEFEKVKDRFGNISEIVTALGVADIASGIKEDIFGSVEYFREIQSGLGLSTDEEVKEFEKIIEGAVSKVSDYDGIISRTDLYEAVNIAVNEFSIRDHDYAVEIGYQLSRFQRSLGIDPSTFKPLQEFVDKGGYDSKIIESIGDDIRTVSTRYRVDPDSVLEKMEGQYSEVLRLAGDDSDVAEALTDRLITAITISEDQKIDSGIMFRVMDDIRDKGYSEALHGSQADQVQIRDSLLVGEFDDAASMILESLGESALTYASDPAQLAVMEDFWGLDSDELSGISIAYERNRHVFSDLRDAIKSDLDESFGAIDDDLKEIQFKSPFDKMISKLGLTKIGDKLASGIESLGLDLSTMLQISLLGQGMKSIGNIGKSIFGKLTGKAVAGDIAGKGIAGKGAGLLSSLGASATNFLGGSAINLGAGTFASGATMSAGGLAATGAGAIGGGLLGGAGVFSGIKDLIQSRKLEDEKERQDKRFSGGTKLGMVGTGAAAGAAAGSFVPVVGTAVGGLVGAGVGGIGALTSGTKVGEWASDKWDGMKSWGSSLFSKDNKESMDDLLEESYEDTYESRLNIEKDLSLEGAEVTSEALSKSYEDSFSYKTEKEKKLLKDLVDEEYKLKKSKQFWRLSENPNVSRSGMSSPMSRSTVSESTQDEGGGGLFRSIGRGISSIFSFGSHRSGLDRVPHDGYGAILHKDETVLNKTEADNYHRDKQAKSSLKWIAESIKDSVKEAQSFDYREAVARAMMSDSSSAGGNYSAGDVSGDAESIWKALRDSGMTKEGTAGLMGNLKAESNLRSNNLQGSAERRLGMTDASYTQGVDDGSYTNFVKDSAGYGLAQWTYHTRKKRLLDYSRSMGTSIADTGMQLEFLVNELKNSYSSVWSTLKDTSSVSVASNKVLLDYESPADQSRSVQSYRASLGNQFYSSLNSYDVGNDMIKQSEVALIHKGEMIVPAAKNPLKGGHTSVPMNDNSEVVQVLKWGFEYLAKKIEGNKVTEPKLKSKPRKREFTSERLLNIGGGF